MQSRLTGGMPAKLSQGPRTGYDLSRMGAGAARGFNGKKKLVAAPWSGTWPAPGATLDLDFANNRGFVRGLGQGGVMDGITFTRASNGNYINEQGLLVGGGTGNQIGANLLTFPQDFDNAAWIKQGTTVTANAASAPDGTNTADRVVVNGIVNAYLEQRLSGNYAEVTLTFSIYLKSNTIGSQSIGLKNTHRGVIDNFQAVTVTTEWQRFSFTVTNSATAGVGQAVGISNLDGAEKDILMWGAQLELGSTATEYFPTNINVPRFDWASTATVAQKNRLSGTTNWGSNQTATLELDGTVGPFPEDKAVKYTPVIWAANRNTTSPPASPIYSNEICTVSIYAKMNTLRYVALGFVDQGGVGGLYYDIVVDLSNGNITQVDEYIAPVSAAYSVIYVGEGWYKVSVTKLCSPQASINIGATDVPVPGFSYGQVNHTPDGIRNLYLCRPQFEIGAVATDYQAIAQPTTNTPLVPTPTCNGLLIEEARTNRMLWCRDATQSSWAKTNVTAAKDQTGIDGVANSASSLTATADGGTCIQTITLASGSRTGSVFLKRLTGTGIVQVSLDGTTWSTVDLSADEWRRIVLSGTVTNPVVGIRLATSGDAVAMDFGQVEDNGSFGTFATSPILTTSAAATRAADNATMSGDNFSNWYNQSGGTVFSEAMFNGVNGAADVSYAWVLLGANTNIPASLRASAVVLGFINGGQVYAFSVPINYGVKFKAAVSFSKTQTIAAINKNISSVSNVTMTQAPITSLSFSFYQAKTYISRFVYLPIQCSASAVFELTR